MQIFDITVPAFQPFVVHATGRYIKYVSGSNGGGDPTLTVTPGGMGGQKITLQPGQAYRFPADQLKPDSWTLANYANGATIVGKVVVGDGQIDDPTIAGTVQVIDGGKFRTLANIAFAGYVAANAVASQYGRVQLWNPAGSAKRLVVEGVTMLAAGSNTAASLIYSNAALANAAAGYSKNSANGAPSPVAIPQWDTSAGPTPATSLMSLSAAAFTSPAFKLNEPFVIQPGSSLMIYSTFQNAYIGASFEWYEEPNT
jgi:hypothetical protein